MILKTQELANRIATMNLSRAEFAERCGISRQAITAWILGLRNPKAANVQIMADVLSCSVEDIAEQKTPGEIKLHEDTAAQIIYGQQSFSRQDSGDDLTECVYNYVALQLATQVDAANQSEVGRKTGLSASQINRIIHGKADLSLFPLGALLKLCPQIINYDIVHKQPGKELAEIITNIKLLAEQINDITVARTIEAMLKGVVEKGE